MFQGFLWSRRSSVLRGFPVTILGFSRDPAIGTARTAATARSAAQRSVYSIYSTDTILFRYYI